MPGGLSRASSCAGSKRASTPSSAAFMPAMTPNWWARRSSKASRIAGSGGMKPRAGWPSRWRSATSALGENLSGLFSAAAMMVTSARTSRLRAARATSRSMLPCTDSRTRPPSSSISTGLSCRSSDSSTPRPRRSAARSSAPPAPTSAAAGARAAGTATGWLATGNGAAAGDRATTGRTMVRTPLALASSPQARPRSAGAGGCSTSAAACMRAAGAVRGKGMGE